jgi:hypothetical protein
MKYILLALALLNFDSYIYGQHSIGIKLNAGLSNVSVKLNNGQTLSHKFYPQPSYHAGIYYSGELTHRLKFGAEIILTQINGKEYLGIPLTDNNNNPTGQFSSDTIWRHFSYLGLPIYIGYNYKKLNLNFGYQTNIRLGGKAREIGSVPYNGDTLTWDNKFTDLSGIDKVDFGLRAGFILNIYKGFSIEGNYYYGVNNNLKDNPKYRKDKIRQLTVGIRYKCFTMNKKSKEKK